MWTIRAASRRAEPEKASSSFWYRFTCLATAVWICWWFLPPSGTAPISTFHNTCEPRVLNLMHAAPCGQTARLRLLAAGAEHLQQHNCGVALAAATAVM